MIFETLTGLQVLDRYGPPPFSVFPSGFYDLVACLDIPHEVVLVAELFEVFLDLLRASIYAGPIRLWLEGVRIVMLRDITGAACICIRLRTTS